MIKTTKKKVTRKVANACAHISVSFNNTFITIADQNGNTLVWSSGGNCGFKGNKKGTPFAAQMCVKKALEKAKDYEISKIDVFIQGPWLAGREASIREINASGLHVTSITDVTPLPHNGVRARKKRNS